ncbi:MAG: VOC family protein [Acidimicrobiales bacterium]
MASRFYTVVIDSREPASLAGFWAAVLDWQIVYEAPDEVVIAKDDDTYPGLVFVPVPEGNEFCVLRTREGGV